MDFTSVINAKKYIEIT